MLLAGLSESEGAAGVAHEAVGLMTAMFPLCRSITGDGVRATLDLLERWVPLTRTEVPTGTVAFDWEVPPEWNIRAAYVVDESGRRVVDFADHNLHVVSYSTPVRRVLSLDELQPHLHSDPALPDLIPYRRTLYRENWGFCLRHRDRERLQPGRYEVVIDSTLAPGSLTYAETVVPGQTDGLAIVYTHTCHPSLANDNLSGIAVAAAIARALAGERPRLTWRFIFGPGTIGSLVWLARNEPLLGRIETGLTLGLLGSPQPVTYKRTRRGDTVTDRVGAYVMRGLGERGRVVEWEPYGYDERQFCSPGFDLPVGRVCRSLHGEYPEYHTSGDDMSRITPERIAESIAAVARMVAVLDANRTMLNLSPKGEPRLGARGLFRPTSGMSPSELEEALLWVLSLSDGGHDLLDVAERSRRPFALIRHAADELARVGLLGTAERK